jgi:hypothetical protein
MARRIFAKNRQKYGPALFGVVLCAVFLTMTIVLNVTPYRAIALFGQGIRYRLSFYLLVILCLVAAIACLIPAIKLRLNSLRMQRWAASGINQIDYRAGRPGHRSEGC